MPTAIVYDCEGAALSSEERAFFRDVDPWGFILFARHCENPEQMRRLTSELCESVGREAPVLIDQEGGRVTRMKASKHNAWYVHPPMGALGELWRLDRARAKKAAWVNGYLLGKMVSACGVTINCAPMLDVRQLDSDPVTVGDRAIAMHHEIVATLGEYALYGMTMGGALPVIKHLPGLGRAQCDSHYHLPEVYAKHALLSEIDWPSFRHCNQSPMAMTGHVLFHDLDQKHCATLSKTIVKEIIRGEIGFDGLLFSDDLKMEALGGDYADRLSSALDAGCDVGLACNFDLKQKQEIAKKAPPLEGKARERANAALAWATSQEFQQRMAEQDFATCKQLEPSYKLLGELVKPVWPVASV